MKNTTTILKNVAGVIPIDYRFRSIHHYMSAEAANTFKSIILGKNSDNRGLWTSLWLFNQECRRVLTINRIGKSFTKLKCRLPNTNITTTRNYALGSLLHLIQDSFAQGHVKRIEAKVCTPGPVQKFLDYNKQNKTEHKKYDKQKDTGCALSETSKDIIKIALNDRKSHINNWDMVKALLDEKVFLLD
jgi:hypothetical protein